MNKEKKVIILYYAKKYLNLIDRHIETTIIFLIVVEILILFFLVIVRN